MMQRAAFHLTSWSWGPSLAALAQGSRPAASEDALPLRLGREIVAAHAQRACGARLGLGCDLLKTLVCLKTLLGLLSLNLRQGWAALYLTSLSALSGPMAGLASLVCAFRADGHGYGSNLLDC